MNSIFEKRKNPLIIIIEPGHERIMAEIFPRRGGGIVFFDVFWQHATGRHPFHEIEGEIVERHGDIKLWWTVGDITVFEADDDDPNMKEWNRWLEVMEDWPREMIEEIAESNGAL